MAAPPRTALDILAALGSPHMPAAQIRYALLTRPNHIATKPVAFESLDQLAASIHRRRGDRGLWLLTAPLRFEGEEAPRQGVSVWTVGHDGAAGKFIGWCWLNGAGRTVLEAALDAQVPRHTLARKAA